MRHIEQVIVTESTEKIHHIREADSHTEKWKIITGCNHVVTDARIMSLNKALDEGFNRCGNCFDIEPTKEKSGLAVSIQEKDEEVRLVVQE